ncbi:MAG: NUDIX domain-containing protein [Clostridiales bacterium]|nr:NUDIX domain-containing protein [Clostridiales bacterium]
MAEYVDLYDLNHQATGRVMLRGDEVPRDCCTMVVSFWVRDRAGRLLLEQRSQEKRWFPGWWECGGGCVRAGETGFDAARREVQEELGFTPPDSRWRLLGELENVEVLEGQFFHHWNLSYLVETEGEPVLQREEVASVRWFIREELDAFLTEDAPVTKYTRRLYQKYRERLWQPMVTGQKRPKQGITV